MNYQKIYDALIVKAKTRNLKEDTYCELHHITPRCMKGSDDFSNLVKLLPEEHIIAHILLVKIHPKNRRLIFAANAMLSVNECSRKTSINKKYGWLRRKYAKVTSIAKRDQTSKKYFEMGSKESDKLIFELFDNISNLCSTEELLELLNLNQDNHLSKQHLLKICKRHAIANNLIDRYNEIIRLNYSYSNYKNRFIMPEESLNNIKEGQRKFYLTTKGMECRRHHSKRMSGDGNSTAKAVIINSKFYSTQKAAAKELGVSQWTMHSRLNSDKYPSYQRVSDPLKNNQHLTKENNVVTK